MPRILKQIDLDFTQLKSDSTQLASFYRLSHVQFSLLCRGRTDGQHNEKPEGGHVSGWDANSGKHIYVADVSGQVDDVWGLQLVEKDGSLDPFHTSISFDV